MSSKPDRAAFGGSVPDRDVEQKRRRGEGVEVGAVVVDADSNRSEPDRAVVLNTPPKPANEWVVYRNGDEEVTVADDNPAYAADSEVVVVAFEDDLDRPGFTGSKPVPLAELECRTYAFPSRRLRRVAHRGENPEDTPKNATASAESNNEEEHPGLSALSDRLGDAANVVVVDGAPVVEVEKLGHIHRIERDGSVDGGPMASQLREAASDVLDGGSE